MPVIQFDYAYLSSVNDKGEQVRMRTILDTSTGYGTACVIDVKRRRRQISDLFCGVVLEGTGVHTISDAGRIPSLRSRQWWMRSSSVCQMIAQSSKSCQRRQFPRVMRVWVLWRAGTIFCKDKFELCDSTSKNDLGSIVGVTHQCVPWLVRHATWLLNRFQRRQNGATAFENLKRVSYKKPLIQFGERCHSLEAERTIGWDDTLHQTHT